MEICFPKTKEKQNPVLQNFSDEVDEINRTNTGISELLAKLRRYQNKILADETLMNELAYYIEPLTKLDTANKYFGESIYCELTFDVKKHLIYSEDKEIPKVLLLTGETGVGKSLFCKNLQREMLSREFGSQDPDKRLWLPIYVELPSLNNPKEEAAFEALIRELSLTKDEVHLLLAPKRLRDPLLPSLLFIFDGFDGIEALYHHQNHSLSHGGADDDLKENFYMSNKFGELCQDARLIITCREENLQDIKRRDLLFAPIDENSSEKSTTPGSFLERKIAPFNDEQITCYLKKYCIFHETFVNKKRSEREESPSLPSDSTKSLSWQWVKEFEAMIDKYKLRESARIPFILSTLTHVLPDIWNQESLSKPKSAKSLSPQLLIELFVSKTIKSIVQNESTATLREGELQLIEKRTRQAQFLALKASGYVLNAGVKYPEKTTIDNERLISELNPLVKKYNNNFRYKFCHPLFLEFFVAKSIEEEIIRISTSSNPEKINPKELFLNQKLLTSKASHYSIILFLRESLQRGKLTSNQLVNLTLLSRPTDAKSQKEVEKSQEDACFTSQSPFAVAAANAITILNTSGYDFSHHDFRKICVPGANLSYGIFEGTDFTGANLKGVDFTRAWLKDANLAEANLEGIELGELPSLKSADSAVKGIAYSANGKYFAAQTPDKVIIFENVGTNKLLWKELRSLPGSFPKKADSPFSVDEKRFVTEIKNNLVIWDIASGKPLLDCNLDLITKEKDVLSFNVDHMELLLQKLFCDPGPGKKTILKYNVTSGSWTTFPASCLDRLSHSDISPKCRDLIILGDDRRAVTLYNMKTGKPLLKQRKQARFCKFSLDGSQILSRLAEGDLHVSDMKRGYTVKSYNAKTDYLGLNHLSWLYYDGRLMLWTSGRFLYAHDVASAKRYSSIPLRVRYSVFQCSDGPWYCLSPGSNRLALEDMDHSNIFWFGSLFDLTNTSQQSYSPLRGANNFKGLNLEGTIIDYSSGLSEENIRAFKLRGDYREFTEDDIARLFQSDCAGKITDISFANKKLTDISIRIIGRDSKWTDLRKLDLSKNVLGDEKGELIGKQRSWPNLEEISLHATNIGDKTAVAIACNPTWKNMKKIQLSQNTIGIAGAEAIGKNKIWENLESLDLYRNQIHDTGASCIGDNRNWKKLTFLNLGYNLIREYSTLMLFCSNTTWKNIKSLSFQGNPVELQDKDAISLIKSVVSEQLEVLYLPQATFDNALLYYLKYAEPQTVIEISAHYKGYNKMTAGVIGGNLNWSSLKKLDLSKNLIADEGGVKIGSNVSWHNLEELDLSVNSLEAKSGIAIGSNTTWTKLWSLNLEGNKIGTEGACMIGKNEAWVSLRVLNLGFNFIGHKGAIGLSKNKTWTNLVTLALHNNGLREGGVIALAKNKTWTNLRTLVLYKNNIGDKGAQALSQNTTWTSLLILNLSTNWISDEGAVALGRNEAWTKLQFLNLGDNKIRRKGATGLGSNMAWTDLRMLNLQKNMIGPEGMEGLSQNTSWMRLEMLNLGHNSIGPQGASALASNTTWRNLQVLTLEYNLIKAAGAAALSKNSDWSQLITLDLSENDIGPEGAAHLSKNTSWENLQKLNLYFNSIKEEGVEELAKNKTWTKLKVIILYSNGKKWEEAEGLSKSTWCPERFGVENVRKLTQNPHWPNLQIVS